MVKASYSCLDVQHEGADCPYLAKNKCNEDVKDELCGEPHHRLLNDCGVAYCHNTKAVSYLGHTNVMFEIQKVSYLHRRTSCSGEHWRRGIKTGKSTFTQPRLVPRNSPIQGMFGEKMPRLESTPKFGAGKGLTHLSQKNGAGGS